MDQRFAVIADIHGNLLALDAVVSQSAGAISAELIAGAYDHRTAAARAEAVGWPDWARALSTGYALPLPGMT